MPRSPAAFAAAGTSARRSPRRPRKGRRSSCGALDGGCRSPQAPAGPAVRRRINARVVNQFPARNFRERFGDGRRNEIAPLRDRLLGNPGRPRDCGLRSKMRDRVLFFHAQKSKAYCTCRSRKLFIRSSNIDSMNIESIADRIRQIRFAQANISSRSWPHFACRNVGRGAFSGSRMDKNQSLSTAPKSM